MPNENKNAVATTQNNDSSKVTMSSIIAMPSIQKLGNNLHLTEKQLQRATSQALRLSSMPNLRFCDKYSLAKYCYETARYDVPEDYIYPVPYNKKVQVQFGYKFYREQCLRTNLYKEVDAVPVFSCDKITRNRLTGKIDVEFEEDYTKTEGAKIVGYYAYATDKKTGELISSEFWSVEKCKEHGQKYSKSYESKDSPWQTSFDKMAMKSVIKSLSSKLRITPEISETIKMDQIVLGSEGEEDTYADNPNNDVITQEDEENETVIVEDKNSDSVVLPEDYPFDDDITAKITK